MFKKAGTRQWVKSSVAFSPIYIYPRPSNFFPYYCYALRYSFGLGHWTVTPFSQFFRTLFCSNPFAPRTETFGSCQLRWGWWHDVRWTLGKTTRHHPRVFFQPFLSSRERERVKKAVRKIFFLRHPFNCFFGSYSLCASYQFCFVWIRCRLEPDVDFFWLRIVW